MLPNSTRNGTDSAEHPLNALAPKSALTILLALVLLSIGFGMSKLINRCYKRRHLRDDRSDVSEHTRHLLRLQKSASRGLLKRRNRDINMSEEERLQWQMTVLSMWQRRPEEENEEDMDPHTIMLSRLRNAWLMKHHRGRQQAPGTENGHKKRTEEELQAEVKRVALAWLAASRASAAVMRRNQRRRSASHYAMMRRLSRAWRQHMGTINEATAATSGDSDEDSYTTVTDGLANDPGLDADLEAASSHRSGTGGYSCQLL